MDVQASVPDSGAVPPGPVPVGIEAWLADWLLPGAEAASAPGSCSPALSSGLSPSTFADVETRARTTFEPATIVALEMTCLLPQGWLAAALNGDIRPLSPPGRPTVGEAAQALFNLTDADLPEEYLDELERVIIIGGFPPEHRLAIWETMKAIRAARKDKHRADRPESYG